MAKAVIGVLVEAEEMWTEGQERIESPCSHDLSSMPDNIKHCPFCGVALYEEGEEVPIEGFDENQMTYFEFQVIDAEDNLIVGRTIDIDDEACGYAMLNLDKVSDALRQHSQTIQSALIARLQPHGLWNAKYFGLWMGEYE